MSSINVGISQLQIMGIQEAADWMSACDGMVGNRPKRTLVRDPDMHFQSILLSSDFPKHSVIPTLLTDSELSTTTLGIVHIHVVLFSTKLFVYFIWCLPHLF